MSILKRNYQHEFTTTKHKDAITKALDEMGANKVIHDRIRNEGLPDFNGYTIAFEYFKEESSYSIAINCSNTSPFVSLKTKAQEFETKLK